MSSISASRSRDAVHEVCHSNFFPNLAPLKSDYVMLSAGRIYVNLGASIVMTSGVYIMCYSKYERQDSYLTRTLARRLFPIRHTCCGHTSLLLAALEP